MKPVTIVEIETHVMLSATPAATVDDGNTLQ
jgi:hypothetical protein